MLTPSLRHSCIQVSGDLAVQSNAGFPGADILCSQAVRLQPVTVPPPFQPAAGAVSTVPSSRAPAPGPAAALTSGVNAVANTGQLRQALHPEPLVWVDSLSIGAGGCRWAEYLVCYLFPCMIV